MQIVRTTNILLTIVALLLGYLCVKNNATGSQAASASNAPNNHSSGETAQPTDVGSVNGEGITQDEFYRRLQRFPITPQTQFPPSMSQQAATSVLSSLTMEKLILELAEQENVTPDQEQIDERKNELNGALADRGRTLENLLQQGGLSDPELDERLKPELAQINILQKYIRIPDSKVRAAYNQATAALPADQKYMSAFYLPQSVRLYAILNRDQKKINDAARLLKKGVTFQTVVEQFSQDETTRAKSGEIGWVEKPDKIRRPLPDVPAVIYQKAFQLKAGGVTPPFMAGGRWIIVKAITVKAARMQPYDHVRGVIRDKLLNDAAATNPELKDLFQKMMKDAKVEVNLLGYKEFFENYWAEVQKKTPAVGATAVPTGETSGAP